jgi:L-lactate dehydrogenase (cytochrome)
MLGRRRVQWREIRRFAGPVLRPRRRDPLERVRTVADFERIARRRTPRAVFDYVDGAAEEEISHRCAVEAFRAARFHPHVLRDVSTVDPTAIVLGKPRPLPVVLGPTGFTRMMRTDGETAVARAAGAAGVPYVLSTLGTTSIEALGEATGADTDLWFQLYVSRDRGRSQELVQRAAAAGYGALVLTVDVPVAGARLRDVYSGVTIPPTLTLRTLLDMARHPRWLLDAVTTEPLAFESLGAADDVAALLNQVFDSGVTTADLEWLRSMWTGPIVVKGVQRVDDARAVVAAGADAIAVSNHGGRQLDRSAAPLEMLPHIVDAVGEHAEVYLDGGVRSGADVAVAVAVGATAVFVGRPYLHALMAYGRPGVAHLLSLFDSDYRRTLQLLGATRTDELRRDMVSL